MTYSSVNGFLGIDRGSCLAFWRDLISALNSKRLEVIRSLSCQNDFHQRRLKDV